MSSQESWLGAHKYTHFFPWDHEDAMETIGMDGESRQLSPNQIDPDPMTNSIPLKYYT